MWLTVILILVVWLAFGLFEYFRLPSSLRQLLRQPLWQYLVMGPLAILHEFGMRLGLRFKEWNRLPGEHARQEGPSQRPQKGTSEQRTAAEVLATPPVATSAVAAPGAVAAPKSSPASAGSAPSPASSIIQELQVADDPKKKCELLKSLGKHRGDDVSEALVRALKDPDEKVRLYAVGTLQDVGDARAVEPLIEVLMTDTARQPCYYATKALAHFKTPRAIAGMVSALEKQKGDLSELAFQLGEVRAQEAVNALCKLAGSSGDEMAYARRHAVMSLGNIGDRRAIPSLRNALNDKDDGVRERAQSALTEFGEAASNGSPSSTVKFFVPPHKPGDTSSEAAYNAIKGYTVQTDPATADFDERRIYAVEYKHNGRMYSAQVGQTEERTKELIHAILGCGPDLVLICTTNRGAMKGYPIFVGKDEIISIVEFAN
jgi:HEAT repeat protein